MSALQGFHAHSQNVARLSGVTITLMLEGSTEFQISAICHLELA